jgi:enoyl-CoA hydratase
MNTLTSDVDGRIAHHAEPPGARQRDHARDAGRARRLRRAANLDPGVHVIALAGAGKGFCGGYDLVEFAEGEIPNHPPARV